MRPDRSNPFPPLTEVKLGAPLSLGPGSGRPQKALKQSALMRFSEWLLNWQYLVLCFLDTGFKGAGCFPALSQMSLKGSEITEQTHGLSNCWEQRNSVQPQDTVFQNTRLLTSRGRILATPLSVRAIRTMHCMSNCQAFQRGPLALSNNI